MNGILIIDKPKDFTSFDVVAVVRKNLHEKKTGHTGTLDPMATGVLPILLGTATKAQVLLPDSNKEYKAKFQLGIVSDTLDITGKILQKFNSVITKQQLESILPDFCGNIMQKPPMYSAVSQNGVRLYQLARKGIEVEREERPIFIENLELLDFNEQTQCGELKINCSKGTYIRTLCDDIGRKLGSGGAVLTELRRSAACTFRESDAISIDKMRELAEKNEIDKYIRPIDSVFACYDSVHITENQTVRFNNGGGLMLSRLGKLSNIQDKTLYRVYSDKNEFLGLGIVNVEKQELSIKKRF